MSKGNFPDIKKFNQYLEISKKAGFLTNNGPLLKKLELRLSAFLNVKNVVITSSGTSALILLIRSILKEKKEVITSPFTFVATVSSINYGGGHPVFADVKTSFPSLSPDEVLKKLSSNTGAILATQVYGYPCDHFALNNIAKKYSIPLIYDCAHGFGVFHKGKPLLNYGNASICSFHETKAFSCGEGGAIFTDDNELAKRCKELRNFSLSNDNQLKDLYGINAKMSEFHAALGNCNLDQYHLQKNIRKNIFREYDKSINNRLLKKLELSKYDLGNDFEYNYSYYPIYVENNKVETVLNKFKQNQIYAKRYFYPSLDTINQNGNCLISKSFAENVLCIPCHSKLSNDEINRVSCCLKEIDNC